MYGRYARGCTAGVQLYIRYRKVPYPGCTCLYIYIRYRKVPYPVVCTIYIIRYRKVPYPGGSII